MAFLKQAKAMVVHPRVSGRGWNRTRRAATSGATSRNLTDQAREILGGSLDPDNFLFTHCTIVASVDTDTPPGVKLGKIREARKTVDRRYPDYLIKPASTPYVNNNGDSWERKLLLASYPTFIGGHNFQEHVQIEEKSKGKLIDAVARDVGDSVYVDLLVATNRKHASLVQDIASGKIATLSMGCTTEFTLCSQCGHYAVDETELCDHIRHAKLNTFLDDRGVKRVIAELCGHVDFVGDADAPGGVRFIEASWVVVPAFTGAVMRNIINAPEGSGKSDAEIRAILAAPTPSWSDAAVLKAASLRSAFNFDEGADKAEGEGEEEEKTPTPPDTAPFKELEDQLYSLVKDKVKSRIEQELREKNTEDALSGGPPSDAPNDSIIREGFTAPTHSRTRIVPSKVATQRYLGALQTLVRVASSSIALVEGVASTNLAYGIEADRQVYRTALEVGALHNYPSPHAFRQACRKSAGRALSSAELRVVVRVSTLLSRWESANNPKSKNP